MKLVLETTKEGQQKQQREAAKLKQQQEAKVGALPTPPLGCSAEPLSLLSGVE